MSIAIYTNIISPHMLPLTEAYRKIYPEEEISYVYTENLPPDATKRGWEWKESRSWIISLQSDKTKAYSIITNTEVLLSGIRDVSIFEKRQDGGQITLYMSERWLKPIKIEFHILNVLSRIELPGKWRLLLPRYRSMVKRFVRWANTDNKAKVLAIGKGAIDDFLYLGVNPHKIVNWGYFVECAKHPSDTLKGTHNPFRILWVGRMLHWKRVDTIIRSIKGMDNVVLTLVGQGVERQRLITLAKGLPVIFKDGMPISNIRCLMRENDMYVLSSDENEGWGVALQEALLEGMIGVGTYEAGSSASILPMECLFHAGDYKALRRLIVKARNNGLPRPSMKAWTLQAAIEKLGEIRKELSAQS